MEDPGFWYTANDERLLETLKPSREALNMSPEPVPKKAG
jgi:hypothetical protein